MKIAEKGIALRPAFAWLLAGVALACHATIKTAQHDLCEGVTCSDMGVCFVMGGSAYCDCEPGYHPQLLGCLPNSTSDPCEGVSCNGHGTCSVVSGQPTCVCDTGYVHPSESDLFCFQPYPSDADADVEVDDLPFDDGEDMDVPFEDIADPPIDEIVEIPPECGNGEMDDGEECDDGNDIDGDGCDRDCTYSCHDDGECDDGMGCTTNVCDSSHACIFPVSPATMLCRPSAGSCDVEEFCDGTSPACPDDQFRPDIPGNGDCNRHGIPPLRPSAGPRRHIVRLVLSAGRCLRGSAHSGYAGGGGIRADVSRP